jgi:hypothetical protein
LIERQHFRKPRFGDLVPPLDQALGDPFGRSRIAVFTGLDSARISASLNAATCFAAQKASSRIHEEKAGFG